MVENTRESPYVADNPKIRSKLMSNLMISEDELDEILEGKEHISIFSMYITSLNFRDYGKGIFELHGLDMKTKMKSRDAVGGCSCLYDVLMCSPFEMRKHGSLFRFIKGNITLTRELKGGELL